MADLAAITADLGCPPFLWMTGLANRPMLGSAMRYDSLVTPFESHGVHLRPTRSDVLDRMVATDADSTAVSAGALSVSSTAVVHASTVIPVGRTTVSGNPKIRICDDGHAAASASRAASGCPSNREGRSTALLLCSKASRFASDNQP